MLDMAKKQQKKLSPAKKPPTKRKGRSYTAWFDPELFAALEKYCAELRPPVDVKAAIETAVEDYLRGITSLRIQKTLLQQIRLLAGFETHLSADEWVEVTLRRIVQAEWKEKCMPDFHPRFMDGEEK